jgi:uncharacterized Tic20 family protein
MQPDRRLAGIKVVRNVNLEKSIMEPAAIGAFIPIVAITLGIGIGALAIWSDHKRKLELIDRLHRERMLALEKGVDPPALPPGMVSDLAAKPRLGPKYLWPRAMRNGLMLLFGGIVLYFAVDEAGGREGAMFMLVPAVLGLANLIYAAVVWKQEKDEPPRLPER